MSDRVEELFKEGGGVVSISEETGLEEETAQIYLRKVLGNEAARRAKFRGGIEKTLSAVTDAGEIPKGVSEAADRLGVPTLCVEEAKRQAE